MKNDHNQGITESFDSFYQSFSYGSRNDLAFKFLGNLNENDASDFIKGLFLKVIEGVDQNSIQDLSKYILEWQIKAYAGPVKFSYDQGPFASMKKPVNQSSIALIASSGHFVKGQDPNPFGEKDLSQEDAIKKISAFIKAKPQLSKIPIETKSDELCVRHGGYDIRAAQKDPNAVFPYQRLKEFEAKGVIGKLAEVAYSFVGACSQLKLQKESIPEWVKKISDQSIDAVIFTPV
jgi:hypothetical protein